jgi:Cellulase (glycosyl hydrolase family 5)
MGKMTGKDVGWKAAILPVFLMGGCSSQFVGTSSLPTSSVPVAESYFGMHIGFVSPGTPWPAVPFGTWRLWDANVTWKDLEPSKGVWTFDKLDSFVALAQQHNVDVILPLALTPWWASERPDESCAYTSGSAAPPTNIQDWIDYVQVVTARYKGKIAYYEMWNETNSTSMWSGTREQLVALQLAAYSVIKRVDPNAQLISANLTSGAALPYMQKLLDLGYANSADIIGYHLYVSPKQPEAIAPLASKIFSLLNRYGVSKPVWNTETGWMLPSTFQSEDQAAGVAVRALLIGRASGIERFIWYEWDNHCCVSLFMTEADNATPTRAALAYANLQKWLVGNTLTSCALDSSGVWSCGLQFSSGAQGVILWTTGKTVVVNEKLSWTPAVLEDMYGHDSPAAGNALSVSEDPVLIRQ